MNSSKVLSSFSFYSILIDLESDRQERMTSTVMNGSSGSCGPSSVVKSCMEDGKPLFDGKDMNRS